ncbi:MAG: glycosyltransferase family 4 protein [Acidobacteria bacterium]|nr:glycosyltransferase family 4 protein [Acidobacteriota bacterium]MBV9071332.1 glycosyltransferase family 4 protein [Acidobacteriota bacterium]MBV9476480.1 glycosyltransferase family 4 protein [Acidobacteriota bacterium]
MRVLLVNRYFHPDHSATSQIASDLAFHLAARGHEVTAVTSRQRYDDARAGLASRESVQGVRIVRVWSTRFGRGGLAGRALDYLTFYASAFFAMLRSRDAIIIAMTDPPLLSVVAALAGRRVVNWVQDLFPEVAEALGIRAPRVLRRLRDWSLRRARTNVVLGDLMAARVPNAVVIHNWADAALAPIVHDDARFSVGYSGNLGRAHEFDTMLAAARMLPDVQFVFTGGGAQLDAVKRAAGANVTFRGYAPREELSASLSSVDAHLVSLQPSLEGLIVPSKFYGILAVARPVLFIGARDGELARIIDAHRCGFVVAPGDAEGLARAIRTLAADPEAAAEMGRRGRELYLARFAPEHAFAAWERVLEAVA